MGTTAVGPAYTEYNPLRWIYNYALPLAGSMDNWPTQSWYRNLRCVHEAARIHASIGPTAHPERIILVNILSK
jgi:hypothetical protein